MEGGDREFVAVGRREGPRSRDMCCAAAAAAAEGRRRGPSGIHRVSIVCDNIVDQKTYVL